VGVAVKFSPDFQTTVSSAEERRAQAPLDSRTVPHPDWVQVSGQIQHTAVVKREGGGNNIIAMLAPAEGGRIMVDLGPADNLASVTLDEKDHVHVRGRPVPSGGELIIVAGELYADGKIIPIPRPKDRPSESTGLALQFEEEPPLSPAAPGR
ncbi:MAG TPA: hypothetical protein VJ746_10115, partial [Nitrospira sp.]|nr:hypothetical protein [Nitrospira sp.]